MNDPEVSIVCEAMGGIGAAYQFTKMALEKGKYYSQDGVTYLCTRDTGIAVYNKLADLVGIYVVLA